jgi:hypothetical protein
MECHPLFENYVNTRERYDLILNILWKTVCIRLIKEHLMRLSSGETIQYGNVLVDQDGINLRVKSLLGLISEAFYSQWNDIKIDHSAGNLIIKSVKNKNAEAELSYRDVNNAHILEAIINIVQKGAGSP